MESSLSVAEKGSIARKLTYARQALKIGESITVSLMYMHRTRIFRDLIFRTLYFLMVIFCEITVLKNVCLWHFSDLN